MAAHHQAIKVLTTIADTLKKESEKLPNTIKIKFLESMTMDRHTIAGPYKSVSLYRSVTYDIHMRDKERYAIWHVNEESIKI